MELRLMSPLVVVRRNTHHPGNRFHSSVRPVTPAASLFTTPLLFVATESDLTSCSGFSSFVL